MSNKAIITFTPVPHVLYVITYKKSSSSSWITPPGNPTTTSPFVINNVESGVLYDFKLQSDCGIQTLQGILACPQVVNLTAINI